jgi:hypothetical protein
MGYHAHTWTKQMPQQRFTGLVNSMMLRGGEEERRHF